MKCRKVKVDACRQAPTGVLVEIQRRKIWIPQTPGLSVEETEEGKLTAEEKDILLKLARTKLESIYTGEKINMDNIELTPKLEKVQGCFTTLTKHGNLRGCIGHILPQEELYKCILENIENAALRDRRFNPVTADELDDIDIEISVLGISRYIAKIV